MFSPASVFPKLVLVIPAWAWATNVSANNHSTATRIREILQCCLIRFSIPLTCLALTHQRDLSSVASFSEDLISHHSDQEHRSHYCKIQRAWDAQQVNQIAQDLKQGSADQHADYRALTATQGTATEHCRGDSKKFISIAVIGGRDRVCIKGEDHSGDSG